MSQNSLIRRSAREALRGKWCPSLLVNFGLMIIPVIANYITSQPLFAESNFKSIFLWFISYTIVPTLSLGVNNYYLQLHRKQEVGFSILFSRFHIMGKGFGISMFFSIIVIGWLALIGIPGLLWVSIMGELSTFVASILFFAFICSAAVFSLRYAMAHYLLADIPEMGVREAIRESKRMMHGRKVQLFLLCLSYIGWSLLVVIAMVLTSFLAAWLATIVGFAGILVLSVYINASIAAFYLDPMQNALAAD